jgi:hypothetical protein
MAYEFNYSGVLKKAWQIAWGKKYLWIWGFILNFFAFLNSFNYLLNNSGNYEEEEEVTASLGRFVNDWMISNRTEIEIMAILALVVVFFVILGAIVAKGALIGAAIMEITDKKFSKGNLKGSLRLGLKSMGKVFGTWFLFLIINVGVGVIVFTPAVFMFYRQAPIRGMILLVLGGLIFLVYALLSYFVLKLAYILTIVERVGIIKSVKVAYRMILDRFWNTLVLALALLSAKLLFYLILFGVLILVFLFFLVIGVILYFIWQQTGLLVGVILGIVGIWFTTTLVLGILGVFTEVAWVNWYLELRKERITDFLSRVKLV